MAPQFTKQSARPLTSKSYTAFARRLRHAAEQVDAYAARAASATATTQDRRALTRFINAVAYSVRAFRDRHAKASKS